MRREEIIKRYILFIISLFFTGLGVAFTKRGGIGISPISSVANVLSYKFTDISMGVWLTVWNCVLIAGQIVVLRKNFKLFQLLQIPLSMLFGWFTNFGMMIVSGIPVEVYPSRILMVLIGDVVLGFGISLAVIANVIMNASESFVKAVSDTTHKNFGNVKIGLDVFCVSFAFVLSLIFFDFKIVSLREGTVISALLVGNVVKFFTKRISAPINKLVSCDDIDADSPKKVQG